MAVNARIIRPTFANACAVSIAGKHIAEYQALDGGRPRGLGSDIFFTLI
jgi:hypothetical protein